MKEQRQSKLYLSGGGDIYQTTLLDKFFLKNLNIKSKILYIPTALKNNKNLFLHCEEWFSSLLKYQNRVDISFDTLRSLFIGNDFNFSNYDAIYIGGGNTWDLIEELNSSGFDKRLLKFYKEGGLIYGGSAGAIILGKKIDTQNDTNNTSSSFLDGLNLLNKYSVFCHYKISDYEKVKSWVASGGKKALCLFEESGLFYDGKSFRSVGSRPFKTIG